VFIDESGFLLIPPVRKTWSPRGRTPVIRHHQLRHRISAISAISVSPRRRRLGLYYGLYEKNIQQPEVVGFLGHLLKHLRGPVIVLWDNTTIHKGELIRDACRRYKRLHLEAFPAYAPELNPDEGVWSQLKNTLANGRPDSIDDLWIHLFMSLEILRASPKKLRACIHKSKLPFFD
jgi:transposase